MTDRTFLIKISRARIHKIKELLINFDRIYVFQRVHETIQGTSAKFSFRDIFFNKRRKASQLLYKTNETELRLINYYIFHLAILEKVSNNREYFLIIRFSTRKRVTPVKTESFSLFVSAMPLKSFHFSVDHLIISKPIGKFTKEDWITITQARIS